MRLTELQKQLGLWVCGIVTLAFSSSAVLAADAPAAPAIRFNRDIRPILADNCFLCHGSDSSSRKAGLRFDKEDGLFSDRKTGKTIVKGDAAHSLIYQRIISTDPEKVMPAPASHKSLTPQQKQLIKDWIDAGAPWQPIWSFVAPVRPALPTVKDAGWVRNPIDNFVLARLESKGLTPAPEADKRTLARRLSYDLTGLPPKPEVVEAFVANAAPDAYEKLVDQMLATREYGEHRARYWLDAARYADSNGLHFDNYREMWPFRDWVMNAFNQNLPFDQFLTQQLAGDLLPHPTMDQLVASGFNRANETTNEGGTIPEENLVFYTRDRTETAARVFMGLTYNCAVCHDHKFDPITQKDFYSLSAFFNNSTMAALDGNVADTPPVIRVPRMEDRVRWDQVDSETAAAQGQLAARRVAARGDFDRFIAVAANDPATKQTAPTEGLRAFAAMSEGQGSTFHLVLDGQPRDVPLNPGVQWQPGHDGAKAPKSAQGAMAQIPDLADFDVSQPFTCAVWTKLPAPINTGAILSRMTEKDNFRGWDMWVQGNNQIGSHFIHQWPGDAMKVVCNDPIDPAQWHHICITYDGSAKAAGLKIYIDGQARATHNESDTLKPTSTTRTDAPFKIGQRETSSPVNGVAVADLHIYGRALNPAEVTRLASANHIADLLTKAPATRTEAETNEVYGWWLSTHDAPYKQMAEHVTALEAEKNTLKAHGASTLVMQEQPKPATAFILFRGDYDKRREEVKPATPASLIAYPADAPRNRLGLAKWLLDPSHPLTARVAVNRYWQEIFGVGLVKTTEDFGSMGEMPSNPELLDWLAVDFRENGWDVKRMFRMLLTSATYRQAATVTPQKLEMDVDNRLLSRGPRFRLDAEEIRDSALAASGLLVEQVGGPSVKPYQPPGVWESVAMNESNLHFYTQDHGASLYRRSVYTFWKRAAPPASMDVFNAPSRETCTVRRERTDTPLQALVTLNDPQFVEAARTLAQHAIIEGGPSVETRVNYMARRLIARPFDAKELSIAQGALDDLLGFYRGHLDDANKLLSIGESPRDPKLDAPEFAAWTMLANQLMNLDEFLNK